MSNLPMFARKDRERLARILEDEIYLYEPRGGGRYQIALLFPNTYSAGMSNLGFHILELILRSNEDVYLERFFYEPKLRPLGRSLEKGIPLKDFKMVVATVPYELDYRNFLEMLKGGGVSLHTEQRGENMPLVIVGGIAPSANPEPLADFADAIYIGEAEAVFSSVVDMVIKFQRLGQSRKHILLELEKFDGVYVPSLYQSIFRGDQLASFHPLIGEVSDSVERIYIKDLEKYPYHTQTLTPHTELSNMVLLELCRGCNRGCCFCLAGCGYLPFRSRSLENVLAMVDGVGDKGGRFGLVATSVGDYPHLKELLKEMKKRGFSVGISSFRADIMDGETLEVLHQLGQKTFTIAPEVGSDLTRKEIGKGLTNQQIMEFVQLCNQLGVSAVKFYFMLGISLDLAEEAQAMLDLVFKIDRKAKFDMAISLAPFVPKAHTPFALRTTHQVATLKREANRIESALRKNHIYDFRPDSIRLARAATLLSLGDRRAGKYLESVVAQGSWLRVPAEFDDVIPKEGSYLPWKHIDWQGKGFD